MEGFKVHFQCWLVVDVNLAAVFFVDLLPPATIEPAPTFPVTFQPLIKHTDTNLLSGPSDMVCLRPALCPLVIVRVNVDEV